MKKTESKVAAKEPKATATTDAVDRQGDTAAVDPSVAESQKPENVENRQESYIPPHPQGVVNQNDPPKE